MLTNVQTNMPYYQAFQKGFSVQKIIIVIKNRKIYMQYYGTRYKPQNILPRILCVMIIPNRSKSKYRSSVDLHVPYLERGYKIFTFGTRFVCLAALISGKW